MSKPGDKGRVEDRRLLTGGGDYTDDRSAPDALYAVFVRSAVAHARLRAVDTADARATQGVRAVFTGADLRIYGGLPCMGFQPGVLGSVPVPTPRPGLADGVVRHVGEAIAMVVADTLDAAEEAAEAVAIDYDPLPVVIDVREAARAGAPLLFDGIAGNCGATHDAGDAAAVEAAFARAARIVRLERLVSRIVPAPMEPRGAIARYDGASRQFHLHTGSQGVRMLHWILAGDVMRLADGETLRITTGDVGGGFGGRVDVYPEDVCILHAARALGRAVRWRSTRSEIFLIDNHARDSWYESALALDAEARFIGLRVTALQSMGAYLSGYGLAVPRSFKECISSLYAIPAIRTEARCILTNTVPTGPFRGAGRPEAAHVIESLVDAAAAATGLDPVEIRRRNLVPTNAFPWKTPQAYAYDCGDFAAVFAKALALTDRDGFPARRAAAEAKGRVRGLGIACFIETAGGAPSEAARLVADADGTVAILSPMQTNGQGHATIFPVLAAERLGLPVESIVYRTGDSDFAPGGPGSGSYGSRSASHFGAGLGIAADALIEKGRALAARMFAEPPETITYQGGRFTASGGASGRSRSAAIGEIAAWAATASGLPEALAGGLAAEGRFDAPHPTFPNGCHVCEIEIDPETGDTTVVSYVAVDDIGTTINATIAHGQMHGGIAQGIGQALGETVVYDGDGQLLSGSFLDYTMPRADTLPNFVIAEHAVPTQQNPLGAKGVGEAGTTGGLSATMSAVADALASRGVAPIAMPATPARIWAALQGGR
ncbi:MAG: xanthine dehydrogenase family protein molybdopterin-binding subunit [Alphaproteobacteria bacterium]|nr:xanthine dehydrogenase family protein molybdopterin-binding subunit [Alphaproteobacteria bacterium]